LFPQWSNLTVSTKASFSCFVLLRPKDVTKTLSFLTFWEIHNAFVFLSASQNAGFSEIVFFWTDRGHGNKLMIWQTALKKHFTKKKGNLNRQKFEIWPKNDTFSMFFRVHNHFQFSMNQYFCTLVELFLTPT
jgi:hypothetical protein